jgi:hypothetical protein
MNPRFLIDEHLLGALPDAIERYNRSALTPIDALCVGDLGAPPRGTDDVDLLRWAAGEQRVMITRDQSTMPDEFGLRLARGDSSAGILIVRRRTSLRAPVEWLALATECSTVAEWTDRIQYCE